MSREAGSWRTQKPSPKGGPWPRKATGRRDGGAGYSAGSSFRVRSAAADAAGPLLGAGEQAAEDGSLEVVVYINGGGQAVPPPAARVQGSRVIGEWVQEAGLPTMAVYWVIPLPPSSAFGRPRARRGDRAAHLGFTIKLETCFCDWPEYFREGDRAVIQGMYVNTVAALELSVRAWRLGWHGAAWPPDGLLDPEQSSGFADDPSIGASADALPFSDVTLVRDESNHTAYFKTRVLLGATPITGGSRKWIESAEPYWRGDDPLPRRVRAAIYHSTCLIHYTDENVLQAGPYFVDVEEYYRARSAWPDAYASPGLLPPPGARLPPAIGVPLYPFPHLSDTESSRESWYHECVRRGLYSSEPDYLLSAPLCDDGDK